MRPLALASLFLTACSAYGQAAVPSGTGPARMTRSERADLQMNAPITSFPLKYATQPNDANEILTGLRLMLDPSVKIYLVSRDNTIILRGLPDDIALATKIVDELDRPRNAYRLTFTLAHFDGGRKLSSSDYVMTLVDGQRATLREGSRVPVQTGRYDVSATVSETQTSYLDVGLNFDATVNSDATGAILKAKVEQSSLPETQPAPVGSNPASVNPTIRQTVMEGVSSLQLGRETSLGTIDSQGTQHTQVEVKLEKLP